MKSLRRREQRRQYQREKRAYVLSIKAERGCADCGVSNPIVLEFDHVRGEKEMQLSQMGGSSWKQIKAEIAKCDVVCCNCHRIRTAFRRHQPAPSSTDLSPSLFE